MKRFRRTDGRRAVAALEFAVVLPIFVLLLLGGGDVTIWLINKFNLDSAAQLIGNSVSSAPSLSLSAFPASYCSGSSGSLNYFAMAYTDASPLAVCGQKGATIISGITNDGTNITMVWQQRSGGPAGFPSLFGVPGSSVKLPPGYSIPSGHSIITTELYTGISPWLFSVALMGGPGATSLYAYSVFEPRLGQLMTPQ
jgi:hypothetical protein